jgi:hypothetical protein
MEGGRFLLPCFKAELVAQVREHIRVTAERPVAS